MQSVGEKVGEKDTMDFISPNPSRSPLVAMRKYWVENGDVRRSTFVSLIRVASQGRLTAEVRVPVVDDCVAVFAKVLVAL